MSITIISNYIPHQSPSKILNICPCSISFLYIIVTKQKNNQDLFLKTSDELSINICFINQLYYLSCLPADVKYSPNSFPK